MPPVATEVEGFSTASQARWSAELSLEFADRGGRTTLVSRRHHGPLAVQRPFYPERDGTCHVYLLHPPGGVAGGDDLTVRAAVGPRARVLLTTPAAQKLYRGFGRRARLRNELRVSAGARLELLPLETIAFDGTDAELRTRVELATGASFVGWDICCLGRPACGEHLSEGRVRQRLEVYRDGSPIFVERADYPGAGDVLEQRWGLAHQPVVATLVCAPAAAWPQDLTDDLREGLHATESGRRGLAAATQLADVVVCRYLGPSVEEAQTVFRAAWNRLRSRLWKGPACPPRIWQT